MTKYSNWKESEKSFLAKHCDNLENIVPDTSICKKDQIEANRHHGTLGYIPKWKRKSNNIAEKQINALVCVSLAYSQLDPG